MEIDQEAFSKVLNAFERIYHEWAVYKSIVIGYPGGKEAFEELINDPDSEALAFGKELFSGLREQILSGHPVGNTLQRLPPPRAVGFLFDMPEYPTTPVKCSSLTRLYVNHFPTPVELAVLWRK